jgi:succinoglycan biosynthesis protein ExoM
MPPAISICVCIFRREEGLRRLLRSLQGLVTVSPTWELIVVDNDAARSAEALIQQAGADGIKITYDVEPIRNVALARSRSVRRASGEWIAFIDDDEEADPQWLAELWKCVHSGHVDAGFGSVCYLSEEGTPEWIRAVYPSQSRIAGASLGWWKTATNNALVRRSAMTFLVELFDPKFGLNGEDSELFYRMAGSGFKFVAAPAARVYERVTADRTNLAYLTRWYFCVGAAMTIIVNGGGQAQSARSLFADARSLASELTGACFFPFSRLRGTRHLFAAAVQCGKLYAAVTGRLPERYRISHYRKDLTPNPRFTSSSRT